MQDSQEDQAFSLTAQGHGELQDSPSQQGKARASRDQLLSHLSRVTNTEDFFKALFDQGYTPQSVLDLIERKEDHMLCKVDLSRETLLTAPSTPQTGRVPLVDANGTTWQTITSIQHKELLTKGSTLVQLWSKLPVRVEKINYIPNTGPIDPPRSG